MAEEQASGGAQIESALGKISQSVDFLIKNSVTDAKMATGIRQVHDSLDEKIFEAGKLTRSKVEQSKLSNNQKNSDISKKVDDLGKKVEEIKKDGEKTKSDPALKEFGSAVTKSSNETGKALDLVKGSVTSISGQIGQVNKSSIMAEKTLATMSSSISTMSGQVASYMTDMKSKMDVTSQQLKTVAADERTKILSSMDENRDLMTLNRKSLDANKSVLDKIKKHIGAIEELDDIKNEIKQDGNSREIQAVKDKQAREALLHDVLTAIKDIKVEGGGGKAEVEEKDPKKSKGFMGWLLFAGLFMGKKILKFVGKMLGKLFTKVVWPIMKKAGKFIGKLIWKSVKGIFKMAWGLVKWVGKGIGSVLNKLTGGLFSKAGKWIKGVGGKISGWFGSMKDGVKNFMGKASEWGGKLKDGFNSIMGKAGGWLTNAKSSITGFMGKAGGWLRGLGSSVTGWLGGVASKGAEIVGNMADKAKSIGKAGLDATKGAAKGAEGGIWGWVKSKAKGAVSLAKKGVGKVGGLAMKGVKFAGKGAKALGGVAMKGVRAVKSGVVAAGKWVGDKALKPFAGLIKKSGSGLLSKVFKVAGGPILAAIGPILEAFNVYGIAKDPTLKPDEKKTQIGKSVLGAAGGTLGTVMGNVVGGAVSALLAAGTAGAGAPAAPFITPAIGFLGSMAGNWIFKQIAGIGGIGKMFGGLVTDLFGMDLKGGGEEKEKTDPIKAAEKAAGGASAPPKPPETKTPAPKPVPKPPAPPAAKVAGAEVAKASVASPMPKPASSSGAPVAAAMAGGAVATAAVAGTTSSQEKTEAQGETQGGLKKAEKKGFFGSLWGGIKKVASVASFGMIGGDKKKEATPMEKLSNMISTGFVRISGMLGKIHALVMDVGRLTDPKFGKKEEKKQEVQKIGGAPKKEKKQNELAKLYSELKKKGFTLQQIVKVWSSEGKEGLKKLLGENEKAVEAKPEAKAMIKPPAEVASKLGEKVVGGVGEKATVVEEKVPALKGQSKLVVDTIISYLKSSGVSPEMAGFAKWKGRGKKAVEGSVKAEVAEKKPEKKGFFSRLWGGIKNTVGNVKENKGIVGKLANKAKGLLKGESGPGVLSSMFGKVKDKVKKGFGFLDEKSGGMLSSVGKSLQNTSVGKVAMGAKKWWDEPSLKSGVTERARTAVASETKPMTSKADDLSEGMDENIRAVGSLVTSLTNGSANQFKQIGSMASTILNKIDGDKKKEVSVYDVRMSHGTGVSYI